VPENGCGGTGLADNLQNADSETVSALFIENGMTSIVQSLPGFSDFISGQKAYFVGERQYELLLPESTCGTVDPVRFTEVQSDESYYISHIYPLIIAGIVVMSIHFATLIVEIILRIRKNEEEDHWQTLFVNGNLLMLLGACVLFIIIGAFGVHADIKLTPNTNYFRFLAYNQCFDQSIVNVIFQVFQGNISNFYAIVWLSISLLIVSCTGMVLIVILGCVHHCYGRNLGFKSYYRSVGRRMMGRSETKKMGASRMGNSKNMPNIEMLLTKQ